ncbi:MAG: tyrosine-type recombinase/integrase [Mycobacterium leprae]
MFPRLVRDAGLAGSGHRRPPRLHDLRHSFAVKTLIRWDEQGLDVEQRLPLLSTYLGHVAPKSTYWYLSAVPQLLELITDRLDVIAEVRAVSTLAPLLQAFFTERLIGQRDASPHTVASYRDAICQLLRFTQRRTGKAPHQMDIDDLDAPLIGAFLNHLETERGVGVRTRNARLTAIRSLFGFAAYRHPEHAAVIQRVLAIPPKRADRALVTYLTETEMQALLAAPDRGTRIGRRDHVLLLLALETGLRVTELTALTCGAVHLGAGAHLRCYGKGRKERITPLLRQTRVQLQAWLTERAGAPGDPLFPGPRGGPLSRDAIRRLVDRHVATATGSCPSLSGKTVTPHTLRHSCAMKLRRYGVDAATIALWLGHEDVRTTYGVYMHADLSLKEKALSRTAPSGTPTARYRPPDPFLLAIASPSSPTRGEGITPNGGPRPGAPVSPWGIP